jgi:hypothetical protein
MAGQKNDMEDISEDIKIDKLRERPKKNKNPSGNQRQKSIGRRKEEDSTASLKDISKRQKTIKKSNRADEIDEAEAFGGTEPEETTSDATGETKTEKKEHTGFKLFVIIGILMAASLIAFVLVIANIELNVPGSGCEGEECRNETETEPDPTPSQPDFVRPPIAISTPTPEEMCERTVNDSWCLGYFENEYGKCLEYPTAEAKKCIDEYYLIRAIKDEDRTLCQYIEDEKISAICLIYLLEDSSKCELHEEMNDYCKAVVERNVNLCQVVEDEQDREDCIILSAKIYAMESKDSEECAVLSDELDRLRCKALTLDSSKHCETEKEVSC